VEIPSNPLAVLTFISAPAVLTNASCVLLFGTGNRYGRAVDRVHELADIIEEKPGLADAELKLRVRQLEAGETRALLIVRALTCFYTSVACFVASTLISLIGAVLVSTRPSFPVSFIFAVAFVAGTVGVIAMISGSALLARETTFSFRVLREEKNYLAARVRERVTRIPDSDRG